MADEDMESRSDDGDVSENEDFGISDAESEDESNAGRVGTLPGLRQRLLLSGQMDGVDTRSMARAKEASKSSRPSNGTGPERQKVATRPNGDSKKRSITTKSKTEPKAAISTRSKTANAETHESIVEQSQPESRSGSSRATRSHAQKPEIEEPASKAPETEVDPKESKNCDEQPSKRSLRSRNATKVNSELADYITGFEELMATGKVKKGM